MRRRRDNGEKGEKGRERRISNKTKTIVWDLRGGNKKGRRGKGQAKGEAKER